MHARRELGLNLLQLRVHPFGDDTAVFTGQHQRRTEHRFFAVVSSRAGANCLADAHVGHVFDTQRRGPRTELEWQALDFFHGLHASRRAHGDRFAAKLNNAAARVLDVLTHGIGDFTERHADTLELVGIGLDDDLLFVTAGRVDLGQAGRGTQARLDYVIMQELEFHQLRFTRRGFVGRALFVFNHVVIDFAETGADGRELRRQAGR